MLRQEKDSLDDLVSVQDALKQLDTTKATFYNHLKRIRLETVKVKGRAFVKTEHLKSIQRSIDGLDSLNSLEDDSIRLNGHETEGELFSGDRLNSLDKETVLSKTVLDSLNQFKQSQDESLQQRLQDKDKLLEEHKDQIKFLRSQIHDLTEALTNQQKLQLMDKHSLKNLQEQVEQLEYKNTDLEKIREKDNRVVKTFQLAIYIALFLMVVASNYYFFFAGIMNISS